MELFEMSEELGILCEHARRWAADTAARTTPAQRADAATGLWREMVELGWPSLAIAEARGGAGLGIEAAAALLQILGGELIASPLLGTALVAAEALAGEAADSPAAQWLPKIAAGETLVAVALANESDAAPRAAGAAGSCKLDGEARFVAWAAEADLLLVQAADAAGGAAVYLVEAGAASAQPLQMVDGRPRAHVRFASASATRLAVAPAYLLHIAQVAQAAEMVGMAERALEITLEYLRTREQFGQLIGAFQALQHRAAQAYIELEQARACCTAAVQAAASRDGELPALAALAKLQAGETLQCIVREMVQMHGGIGMTAEHVAGDYLKAARVAGQSFGAEPALLRQYAQHHNF